MSSDIKPVLVKDNLLCCTDDLAFGVSQSGSNVTTQRFVSNSVSPTVHNYQINVPSLTTVVDRELLWRAQYTLTITGTCTSGNRLVQLGEADALAAFPLHALTTNMTAQINNTSVNMQTNQIMDVLLRSMDRKELARYNSSTPTYLDNYQDFAVADGKANNPLGSYGAAVDPEFLPRGGFQIISMTGNTVATAEGQAKTVVLKVAVCEPLLLSPFVFGDAAKGTEQGFYGISQIILSMAMDPAAKRSYNYFDNGNYLTKSVAVSYDQTDCWLEARFVSPKASDLLPAQNVVPYANFVLFPNPVSVPNAAGQVISSSVVQLNGIPDKVFIKVGKKFGSLTGEDANAYLPIRAVSIQFNNQSGILSNTTDYELFRMSQEAGSKQTWTEFSGKATEAAAADTPFVRLTTGSVLVLDFAKHINISEEYYAPSSLGTFSLQVQVTVDNTWGATLDGQLDIITMSSGVFVCNNGSSTIYQNVLGKEMVLAAAQQPCIPKSDVSRYVGGSLLGNLWSMAKKALPFGKAILSQVPHPAAQAATGALGALGFGEDAEGGARRRKGIRHRLM